MGAKKRNLIVDKVAGHITSFVFTLMRLAPRNAALWIGSALGNLFWIVLGVQRKRLLIAGDNLKNLYPNAVEDDLKLIVKRMCRHFCRCISDFARIPDIRRGSLHDRIRFEGLEHFLKARAEKRGVILATAHFGHSELGACALALMGHPVFSVIRKVDNIYVDELLDSVRRSTGLGIIKKESASKEIIGHLRAGHVVTIHTDLHAAFNKIFVRFFGKWAATFITPAVLNLRTKAPVLPMFCFRDDATDSYTIRFYPKVKVKPAGDISADVRQITTHIAGVLENVIREAPEQWFWLHRRWKEEPDGKELEAIKKQEALIDSATGKAGATVV